MILVLYSTKEQWLLDRSLSPLTAVNDRVLEEQSLFPGTLRKRMSSHLPVSSGSQPPIYNRLLRKCRHSH